MVTTHGLPRRDRDPPRHARRPLGRLQGHRRRPTSAGATGFEVAERVDYDGEVLEPSSTRTRRASVARDPAPARASRPSPSASSTPTPTRRHEQRMREILEEELPDVSDLHLERACCRRSSSTSASRPRSPTPCSRRSSAATCSGSSARLEDGGYDGDLLILHSGGGVMTPETVAGARRPAGRLGHRRGRDRQRATSPRCAATRTRSASTWAARAPTSRSSTRASCGPPRSGSSSTATRSASRRSRC